ncbi:hypothetical protein DL765_001999 [Monosporascus sp. GIB2]|nr:hypothetical protein DL765_001999 [Monosporascus sp. GIB2]
MENFGNLSPSEQEAILTTRPGAAPPNGTVPNFNNPPTSNDAGILVVTICVFLVTFLLSLRLYSRVFVVGVFKLEDYLGFASYFPFLGLVGMLILLMRRVGFMVDQWDITLGTYLDFVLYLFIFRIMYALFMLFSKTAILLEWNNIFVPNKRRNWFFWASRIMVVINIMAYTGAAIVVTLSCVPTRKIWTPWMDGTCFARESGDRVTAWVNLAIDTAILLLPQPIIWKLNVTRQRKIGVSFIFSIGLLVVACAVGRTYSNMTFDYHGNTSHDGSIIAVWGFGETAGVIMVFSAPGIPKAFSNCRFLAGVRSTLRSWTPLNGATAEQGARSKRTGGSSRPPTIGGGGRRSPRKPTATEMDLMETLNGDYVESGLNPHTVESNGQVPKT